MSFQTKIEQLDSALAEEFESIGAEVRRRVADLDGLQALATRSDGDTTHSFDRFAEDRILRILSHAGLDMVVSSEESSEEVIGSQRDYIAIVDPIDKSDMVARGYPYGSIAATFVDINRNYPVFSRIYEIFTGVQYSAMNGVAKRNNTPIHPSRVERLEDAFVVSYSATYERRMYSDAERLPKAPARLFLNNSSSLDIAKVGAGQCDGVVEILKGYYPRDFLPGFHIATCAGAVSCGLDGKPIRIQTYRNARTFFLVAATTSLLQEMLQAYSRGLS